MANRRPNTKTIEKMITWLNEQGIHLYTDNADFETGQRSFGCRDVTEVNEVLNIYKHNKNNTWKDPVY